MSGHYPFYRCCNINRGARGAVRHCHFDNPKWLWQGGDQPRQAVAYIPASLEALRCHWWRPPTTPCSAADVNLNTHHLCMTPNSAPLPHLRVNTASCQWEKTNSCLGHISLTADIASGRKFKMLSQALIRYTQWFHTATNTSRLNYSIWLKNVFISF